MAEYERKGDCIVDISKIVSDSIDKSIKHVANEKFDNIVVDDPTMSELAGQDAMLMNYTNILLETYHKELKKELSKHGIEI